MIPMNKLGWFAGVIDLKGRARAVNTPSRKNPLLTLRVDSRELPIIRELCSLTGTRATFAPEKHAHEWQRKGCIEHCPEPHVHIDRTMPAMGTWHITGAGAAIVLYNLLPFLLSDRGFTELMDDALAVVPESGPGRHAIDLSIRRLKDLGWEIPPGLEREENDPDQGAETDSDH